MALRSNKAAAAAALRTMDVRVSGGRGERKRVREPQVRAVTRRAARAASLEGQGSQYMCVCMCVLQERAAGWKRGARVPIPLLIYGASERPITSLKEGERERVRGCRRERPRPYSVRESFPGWVCEYGSEDI